MLPVHHAAGGHFGLVVPEGRPGPSPAGELAAGRRAHHAHHRSLYHLRPVDSGKCPFPPITGASPEGMNLTAISPPSCAGVLPLPLPAVFRVEKNEPESTSAHSRNEGVQLFPARPALYQTDEEIGQREYRMTCEDDRGRAGAGAERRCTRRLEKHLLFRRLFKRALVGPRKED